MRGRSTPISAATSSSVTISRLRPPGPFETMRRWAYALLTVLAACKKPPSGDVQVTDAAPPVAREAPPPPAPSTQPFVRVVAAREGSMVVVGSSHAYVADEDAAAIVAVDLATMKVAGTTAL